jgi:2-methylaconitate cis-trans-isomerase PrpF
MPARALIDLSGNQLLTTTVAATAATATAAAAVATTTAATAAGFVLRFIDFQRATAEVLAVEGLHGALRIGARHFHEAEAARLARVAIVHERDLFDGAVSGEQGTHGIFRGAEGEISNIEFGQEKILRKI